VLLPTVKQVLFVLLIFCPLAGFSQAKKPVAPKKPAAKPAATKPKPAAEPAFNWNIVPFFGERPLTPEQERFLLSCDRNFGSREEASQFFAQRAWEYVQEGQLDTATYRFNLAHLLNPKSVDPYWGLGVIQFNKGNSKGAVVLLNRGLRVDSTNTTLMTDLATIHLGRFGKDSTQTHDLDRAEQLLTVAVAIDTASAGAFQKLAVVDYYRQRYDDAWQHLHRSRALGGGNLDFQFLSQLMARKEDPLGVFKQQN
jgi:Tfp pilus assembly protein PilF